MSGFVVTVRRIGHAALTFHAIGTDSAAVHMAALDVFGASAISVRPQ